VISSGEIPLIRDSVEERRLWAGRAARERDSTAKNRRGGVVAMAQIFERGQRVGFDEVPCQLALLGEDHEELPLPRQDSRISWTTEWSVRILEPRSFELTGSGLAAWHVAIYVEGELNVRSPDHFAAGRVWQPHGRIGSVRATRSAQAVRKCEAPHRLAAPAP